MSDKPKIKYALLTIDENIELKKPFVFDDQSYLTSKKLEQFALSDRKRTKHWRDWLGSLKWKEINEAGLLFVTWRPTETPDVMDGETKELEARISCAWHAFM